MITDYARRLIAQRGQAPAPVKKKKKKKKPTRVRVHCARRVGGAETWLVKHQGRHVAEFTGDLARDAAHAHAKQLRDEHE